LGEKLVILGSEQQLNPNIEDWTEHKEAVGRGVATTSCCLGEPKEKREKRLAAQEAGDLLYSMRGIF